MISYKEGYAVFRPINLFHFDSQFGGGVATRKKTEKNQSQI